MHAPASVARYAANYSCGHCNSDPATLRRDQHGTWHVEIPHDDGCPVLAGTISDLPDATRAAIATTFHR